MNYLKNLFKGRLGRKDYFVGIIILTVYVFIIVVLSENNLIPEFVANILAYIYILFRASFVFRRCNDFNKWKRGAVYVFTILSPLMLIWGDLIWFSGKGNEGKNKYGLPINNKPILKNLFNPN